MYRREMRTAADPPGPQEVRLWAVQTDPFSRPELLDACHALLSDGEKKRAARFITPAITERFVISHALLRDVMSETTGLPPEELEFCEDDLGRPLLSCVGDIDFNLSHTNGMAVVAVARHKLGVDVERLRAGLDLQGLGRRVLSPRERETLEGEQGLKRFFEYWTLKEAYAKALGIGIRMPFRDIDLKLGEHLAADLTAVADAAAGWRFELFGDATFRVAVVVKSVGPGRLHIRAAERIPTTAEKQPWTLARLGSSHP